MSLSCKWFFIFLLSVLLQILEHVKLIVGCEDFLENIMQNRASLLDKEKAVCPKTRTDDPREESITEDSKETLSLRTLKGTLSLRSLKRTLSMGALRSFRTLNDFWTAKKSFWLFGIGI